MVVYKWLPTIKVMLSWGSMQEYTESMVYEHDKALGDMGHVMVEKDTKLWKE
jgi:hypothetical protein